MTRSSLRRQFEEEPKPNLPVPEDLPEFKSKQLYLNIALCLTVVFMCTMSINWMNADITGEYAISSPEHVYNNKNFPPTKFKGRTNEKAMRHMQGLGVRTGGTEDTVRLSLTRGPLTMYGDLTVDGILMNLISREAPRSSKLDLLFETSAYDVKLGYPKKRLLLRGEMKDGVIDGVIQTGGKTREVRLVRDGMASIWKRIQSSPLFGHWRWPWEAAE